jgi:prepilin-type N-terminal cleavage/methylation domain-containing protein
MRLSRAVERLRAVRADRAGDDRGLTLIELLVVIAILGVIVVPLADALINYFQHQNDTTDRLSVSRDSQIAAAFFAQDVASMGRRDWGTSDFPRLPSLYTSASSAVPCAISGQTLVVRLVSDLPQRAQGSAGLRSVAYVLVPGASGLLDLHRLLCGSASSTPTSDLVVASNVDPGNPPVLNCPDTTCVDGSVPQSVRLVLHLKAPSNNNDSLTVTLYGQRRQT